MRISKTAKWLACVGVVGAVGAGTAFGLVGAAAAAPGSSNAAHVSGVPVTTASFNFRVAVSGLASSPVDVTGTGQANFNTHAVALAVNLPAVVAKLLPGGSGSPEVVKAVYSQGTVYLRVPSLEPLVGKPWISVTLPAADATSASGVLGKVASGLGDVNAIVHLAHAHHATVTSLGSSVVNGVSVTGEKVAVAFPHKRATITAGLFANAADQLVQAKVKAGVTTKKRDLGLTATVNLSGYGDPVSITPPPSAQVTAVPFQTVESVLGSLVHRGNGHKGLAAHALGLLGDQQS